MTRSIANRLARKYNRRSLVADMFTLHGAYDLARAWLSASRDDTIRVIETILSGRLVQGELRERFSSCLIAERYLRRTDRMQVRTGRLSREEIEAKLFLDDLGIGFERESAA
jgi:hypothetical protein